jgi:hypothetical protein
MPKPSSSAMNRRFLVDGGNGGLIDRRRLSAAMVQRYDFDRVVRRRSDGGRRFCFARRRDHLCLGARARRESHCAARSRIIGDRLGGFRKADRLPAVSEPSVARCKFCAFRPARGCNNHELVRTRAYVRVSGNLSLTVSDLSANIPPFNPQKLLADAVGGECDDQTPAAEPDAEVSFVTCDLAAAPCGAREG